MANSSVRVLHVDDLEEEYILARELLSTVQGVHFEFQWVPDIRTANQVIHNSKFDVCLVDYYMGMDRGLDFIRGAVANGITIPFILMSGQKDPTVEREALKMGVRQCLDKNDITAPILLKAIQDALRR
jgi:two-component system, cell cycle sensor histidine kinase and response regulator CckA